MNIGYFLNLFSDTFLKIPIHSVTQPSLTPLIPFHFCTILNDLSKINILVSNPALVSSGLRKVTKKIYEQNINPIQPKPFYNTFNPRGASDAPKSFS